MGVRTKNRCCPSTFFKCSVFSRKRTVRLLLFGVLALSIFFSVTLTIRAQTSLTPEQEEALKKAQDKKEDQLGALKDKIKTYEKIVDLKEKEEGQLVTEAKRLDAQSTALEGNITDNERRLSNLGQEIESLQSRIVEKERVIGSQKRLLVDILRSYSDSQISSGDLTPFLLASSSDIEQVLSGRDRLFEFGSGIRETLSSVVGLRDTLFREQDLAREKRVEIESVKLRLEQQNAYLENSKKQKEALAAQAAAEQEKYENVISDLEKERKAIEDEIEELDAARAGKIDLSSIPNFSSGVLGYPVKNPRKSQGYGKTTFTKWYTFHNGIDFADNTNTPILAAEDGTVIATGNSGKYAYGKWIAIRHKNGLTTLYGHLNKQIVSKGKSVDRGDTIGLMGSTGYSTGTHVHFSVFSSDSFEVVESKKIKNVMIPTGAHINPAKYL